jgi:hypothetical protein
MTLSRRNIERKALADGEPGALALDVLRELSFPRIVRSPIVSVWKCCADAHLPERGMVRLTDIPRSRRAIRSLEWMGSREVVALLVTGDPAV